MARGSANRVGPLDRIADAFTALDSALVPWALLRPIQSVRQPDGDIDILVATTNISEARGVLEAAGFVAAPSGWPGDAVMVDRDDATGVFCWLHVQAAVRIGLDELSPDGFLTRAIRLDGVSRVSDPDLLSLLVLHGLLDTGTVKPKHRDDVTGLIGAGVEIAPWATDLAAARGVDVGRLCALLDDADWAGLEALVRELPERRPTFRNRVSGRSVRIGRLWSRRGMSIAVIGPDGAGKSSLVRDLPARLPASSSSMYMGLTGGRMPLADRLRVPGVVLAARLMLIWTRRLVAWRRQLGREIVLFDRYPIDGGVPPGFRASLFVRGSRAVQRRSCPPPSLAILLDAPGAVLHERSGEYDAATLEEWRVRYLELADECDWITVLDAQRPPSEILDEASTLVWNLYRRRWSAD